MMKEFSEDGWKFRISYHDSLTPDWKRRITVRFYDNSLPSPSTEDVHKVEHVSVGKSTIEKEIDIFGYTLLEWEVESRDEDALPPLEEDVETAIEKARERIDEIEQSPSEKMDGAIRNARRGD